MPRDCRAHIQGKCRSLNAALARWRRARYNIPCIRAQGDLFGLLCAAAVQKKCFAGCLLAAVGAGRDAG